MGIRARSCLVVAFGLLLAGCPTFSNLKTARALDEGEFQFTVAPEIEGASIPSSSANGITGSTFVAPQIEVAARYGITDGFDIGAKLWIAGAELDTTISLIRGGFFDLALAPGVGFLGIGAGSGSTSGSLFEVPIYIPLLAGLNLGYGHQFVFGVEAIPNIVFASATSTSDDGTTTSSSGTSVELFLGGTVGFSFKIGSSFRIMPELNVFVPVVTASANNGSSASELGLGGVVIFQGGLGFSFGGDGFGHHPNYSTPPPM